MYFINICLCVIYSTGKLPGGAASVRRERFPRYRSRHQVAVGQTHVAPGAANHTVCAGVYLTATHMHLSDIHEYVAMSVVDVFVMAMVGMKLNAT